MYKILLTAYSKNAPGRVETLEARLHARNEAELDELVDIYFANEEDDRIEEPAIPDSLRRLGKLVIKPTRLVDERGKLIRTLAR